MAKESIKVVSDCEKEPNLRKAEAEADKTTLDLKIAKIPSGKSNPLEGTITTNEGYGYIAETVSYYAMSIEANKIGALVSDVLGTINKILIVDSIDFVLKQVSDRQIGYQLNTFYKLFSERINEYKSIHEAIQIGEDNSGRIAFAPTVSGTLSLLSVAADIVGLFSANYSITEPKLDISAASFRITVASNLLKKSHKVFMSPFNNQMPPVLFEFLSNILEKRFELADIIKQLDKNDFPSTGKEKIQIKIESYIVNSQLLLESFDAFNTSITTTTEDQEYSALTQAALNVWLLDAEQGPTQLLNLDIASSGGQAMTSRNLWKKARVDFMGGGAFTYLLTNIKEEIIIANTKIGLPNAGMNVYSEKLPTFYP